MSRESDEKLLTEFVEWYVKQPERYYEPRLDVTRFLASRAPAPEVDVGDCYQRPQDHLAVARAYQPAPEGERFWRVKEHPGWHAVEHCYDEQGRLHTKPLTTVLRDTREAAEEDGFATGLPYGKKP